MKEKDFQIKFGKWLKENFNQFPRSAVFELKQSKTNSLPFSSIVEHQIQGLWHAKHRKIYHKIVDAYTQNPFDCLILVNTEAYVVIRYGSGKIFALDIDTFIQENNDSKRRSLTEERASVLASFCL